MVELPNKWNGIEKALVCPQMRKRLGVYSGGKAHAPTDSLYTCYVAFSGEIPTIVRRPYRKSRTLLTTSGGHTYGKNYNELGGQGPNNISVEPTLNNWLQVTVLSYPRPCGLHSVSLPARLCPSRMDQYIDREV